MKQIFKIFNQNFKKIEHKILQLFDNMNSHINHKFPKFKMMLFSNKIYFLGNKH